MPSRIELIPLDRIVLEPEREAARRLPAGVSPPVESDALPPVILSLDQRLIAGRGALNAYQQLGRRAIPCRLIASSEIDTLLTSIHNRILFGDLAGEALHLQLDQYGDLCRYRQLGSAATEQPPPVAAAPQGGESDATDDRRGHDARPAAGTAGDEPGRTASGTAGQLFPPRGLPGGGGPWLDHFRFF